MMTLYRPTIVCLSLCWALMCGSAMADDPSVDPCSLLSKADVEQIIGKLKGIPTSQQIERARLCEYEFVDEERALELWVFPASGLERARTKFKNLSPVTGLGQEAFVHHNMKIDYTELFVKKGNVTLEVSLPESPGDEEKAKAIARKALSRL